MLSIIWPWPHHFTPIWCTMSMPKQSRKQIWAYMHLITAPANYWSACSCLDGRISHNWASKCCLHFSKGPRLPQRLNTLCLYICVWLWPEDKRKRLLFQEIHVSLVQEMSVSCMRLTSPCQRFKLLQQWWCKWWLEWLDTRYHGQVLQLAKSSKKGKLLFI